MEHFIHETLEAAECSYIYSHFLAQETDTRFLFDSYDLNWHERNWDIIEREDRRLNWAISVCPSARGKFRMSAEEL